MRRASYIWYAGILVIIIVMAIAIPKEINSNAVKDLNETEITRENALFDIFVDIPEDYRIVSPGDELLASIKLINIGSQGRIDVFLDYHIIDPKQSIIVDKVETVAVETQANFVRTFGIPKDAKPGNYKLAVNLLYADGKKAEAEYSFKVHGMAMENQTSRYLSIISIAVVFIALLAYILIKSKAIVERVKLKLEIDSIVKKKLK